MSAYTGRVPHVPARFKCVDCATSDGCDEHRVFKCDSCSQPTWYGDGGDDDRPYDCSTCWLAWFEPRSQIAAALAGYLEMI